MRQREISIDQSYIESIPRANFAKYLSLGNVFLENRHVFLQSYPLWSCFYYTRLLYLSFLLAKIHTCSCILCFSWKIYMSSKNLLKRHTAHVTRRLLLSCFSFIPRASRQEQIDDRIAKSSV